MSAARTGETERDRKAKSVTWDIGQVSVGAHWCTLRALACGHCECDWAWGRHLPVAAPCRPVHRVASNRQEHAGRVGINSRSASQLTRKSELRSIEVKRARRTWHRCVHARADGDDARLIYF